jgi:hypothetical protein
VSEVALSAADRWNAGSRVGDVIARVGVPGIAIGILVALTSALAVVGADAYWLAALGRAIVDAGEIPDGVPFATAPTSGWENVPVLGELSFYALAGLLGAFGLVLAQIGAVAVALLVVRRDAAAAGARPTATAAVLGLLFVAAFPAFVVARAQLFSLPLFVLLAWLLRAETRRPSRRVWLLPPLFAVWANLHGAVLVGVAVAGAYLLFGRFRRDPWGSCAALAASIGALNLTPSLERTTGYYVGVLGNEAAGRGVGLWAPLSFTSVTGVLTIAGCVVLVALAARARPAAWETVTVLGLAALTVQTGRSAVWLALFIAPLAARAVRFRRAHAIVRPRVALALAAGALLVFAFGVAHGPAQFGAGDALVERALAASSGGPVLAEDQLAEQVAYAGGRVIAGNPIDAFDGEMQALYLDWVAGDPRGDALTARVDALLVRRGGPAAQRLATSPAFAESARDAHAVLYVRKGT